MISFRFLATCAWFVLKSVCLCKIPASSSLQKSIGVSKISRLPDVRYDRYLLEADGILDCLNVTLSVALYCITQFGIIAAARLRYGPCQSQGRRSCPCSHSPGPNCWPKLRCRTPQYRKPVCGDVGRWFSRTEENKSKNKERVSLRFRLIKRSLIPRNLQEQPSQRQKVGRTEVEFRSCHRHT